MSVDMTFSLSSEKTNIGHNKMRKNNNLGWIAWLVDDILLCYIAEYQQWCSGIYLPLFVSQWIQAYLIEEGKFSKLFLQNNARLSLWICVCEKCDFIITQHVILVEKDII